MGYKYRLKFFALKSYYHAINIDFQHLFHLREDVFENKFDPVALAQNISIHFFNQGKLIYNENDWAALPSKLVFLNLKKYLCSKFGIYSRQTYLCRPKFRNTWQIIKQRRKM